jgi:uncharacterized protein YigE (DUF2233 family)
MLKTGKSAWFAPSVTFVLAAGFLSLFGWESAGQPALPSDGCREISEVEHHYIVCSFDVRRSQLRLFWQGPDGKPFGGFASLAAHVRQAGETLIFAMNAGMFQPDFSPVGLYVEAGHQIKAANTRSGSGNFHLQPNGVFYFDAQSAGVLETARFLKADLHAEYATQSGPMLVIGGALHPKIEPSGTSEKIRNGVGVKEGHIVIFAISLEPVTFFRFASLFRDRLGCPDALYLDGSISSLYAPALNRADNWLPIGPIVAVVEKPGK